MADDRWLSWQAEQAGTNRRPSIAATLLLFAVITVVLISMLGGYDRVSEDANRGKPPSLCEEHKGRPGWDYVCRPREERLGVKR